MLAPVLAFSADEAWDFVPGKTVDAIHQAGWEPAQFSLVESERIAWNTLFRLREIVLPKLEEIKSGNLEAAIEPMSGGTGGGIAESNITIQSGSHFNLNDEHLDELREITSSYQVYIFLYSRVSL